MASVQWSTVSLLAVGSCCGKSHSFDTDSTKLVVEATITRQSRLFMYKQYLELLGNNKY